MDALSFWKQKIIQFFHDPPNKPFVLYPGTGGHRKVASELFETFSNEPLQWVRGQADWAASGADRPVFPKALNRTVLDWRKATLLTHPLAESGAYLDPTPEAYQRVGLSDEVVRARFIERPEESFDPAASEAAEKQEKAALARLSNWQDCEELRRQYCLLWRRFRDVLMRDDPEMALVWGEMPAESRLPDHSIWDHLRMTSALAFLTTSNSQKVMLDADHAQTPWMLRVALSPIQGFIREARTTRDLWVGSFLLADLSWHAMQPIVEQYGPDAIVYPDLRANPLVDNFLLRDGLFGLDRGSLLADLPDDAASYAALLPASFTALVPRGGKGALIDLEDLAQRCEKNVHDRWQTLEALVDNWLEAEIGGGDWRAIWQRQHARTPIRVRWSAVPWLRPLPVSDAAALQGHALPVQPDQEAVAFRDQEAVGTRKQRFIGWLPPSDWAHYERARDVYAHANLGYINLERGFDYALTHHQLWQRHALVKQQPDADVLATPGEPGEKCTNCGKRQALTNSGATGSVDGQRQATRRFWSHPSLDPEKLGIERLCGVCAFKRFLVPAGVTTPKDQSTPLQGINPNWAGLDKKVQDVSGDAEVRVPFPSAATIAAQAYIEAVLTDTGLTQELSDVVAAHRAADLTATTFPRALPRLAAVEDKVLRGSPEWQFLIREAQETLFPEAVRGMARSPALNADRKQAFEGLAQAIEGLRNKAATLNIPAPSTRLAVVKIDGDRMGKLLLGAADAMGARWRDVLHPEFVKRLEAHERGTDAPTGWMDLLCQKRLMGPALHAFVTRALAEFQHRIVPWVVEREFSGRLIYSGGDDVLCLAPADEALDLCCRLQQLFSAPWVVDCDPDQQPWHWRGTSGTFNYDQQQARQRFWALQPGAPEAPLRAPYVGQLQAHPDGGEMLGAVPNNHRVIPLLGAGQSLSAGIAVGHFKMPLGVMLREAGSLLDGWAKERAGRGAVALGYATRGGTKNRFAMCWCDGAHRQIKAVIDAFRSGELPGRLPYKLREVAPVLQTVAEASRPTLAKGLLHSALGDAGEPDPNLLEAVLSLWQQGMRLTPDAPACSVEGLLLCRALASADSGEEE